MRGFTCAVIMIALTGDLSPARGDGAGVIAASANERGELAAAMADAIAGRSRRVVPDAAGEARAALASGAVAVEVMARFRRVREQVDEGWRAYLRNAGEFAAQRLASARTEAEPLVALPGGAEVYADAALRLGAVLGHLGRKQESQAVLRLALAIDPDRPITFAEFSPDVVELVDAARALQPGTQQLAIASTPPGAMIFLDSKELGKAPQTVTVARGQHIVVARLPEHQPVVQGVALEDPATVTLALERDEDAARLAAGATLGLAEPAQQQLVTAALRYADLDEVIVVAETARRGGLALLAQRCAGVPAKCSAVVDIGFEPGGRAAAARAVWDAVRAGELRYPPTVLGERGAVVAASKCKLCRNPWLWTGIGAALVTGAIITLVVTSSDKPPPVVGVDPGDFIP